MADTTLDFELLTLDDRSKSRRQFLARTRTEPRRHFIAGTKPQVLAVPQEITDLIVAAIEESESNSCDFVRKVTILRLVSRTFDLGLFSYFTKIMLQIGFNFRLDEEGIEAIARLAESRLAPFVQRIRFADRQPSPHILTLRPEVTSAGPNREMSDEKPRASSKADVVASWAKWKDDRASRSRFGRRLFLPHDPPKHWEQAATSTNAQNATALRPMALCNRGHQQRIAFSASYASWHATWDSHDCLSLQTMDLQPSAASLQRLADVLSKFESLEEIITHLSSEVHGIAKDSDGKTVDTRVFHGDLDYDDPSHYLRRLCDGLTSTAHPTSLWTGDYIWPAIIAIGLMNTNIQANFPLFSTLASLRLDFHQDIIIQQVEELVDENIVNVATFISRCRNLKTLVLTGVCLSKRDEYYQETPTNLAVSKVLLHLASQNASFPDLEKIELDDVGDQRAQSTILTWLASHTTKLLSLEIRAALCLDQDDELLLDRSAWQTLVIALFKAPYLQRTHFYHRPVQAGNGDVHLHEDYQLHLDHWQPMPGVEIWEMFVWRMGRCVGRWNERRGTLYLEADS